MTMRDKLIEILVKTHRECDYLEQKHPYPCEGCKYKTLDRRIRGCIFDRFADAIIESGLLRDTELFMKHWLIVTTNEYSDKLQSHLIKAPYESAAVYELCQNHIGSGMSIIDIKQIEEKTFSAIKEYKHRSGGNEKSS